MKFWTRFPLFRFLIPFGAGILTNIYSKPLIINCILISLVAISLSFLFTKNNYATGKYALRWMAGIPFYIAFWGIGCLLSWLNDAGNYHSHFSDFTENSMLAIEASEPATETKKGIRIFAKVKAIKNCEKWITVRGNLVIYVRDTSHQLKVKYHDNLLITAKYYAAPGPSNPEAFDFREYLRNKGIHHQAFIDKKDMVILKEVAKHNHFSMAYDLRDKLLQKIGSYINKDESGVAAALLLGYEGWLDPEQELSYSNAGVLHVLCVSGMHVALIYNLLAWLTGWMDKKRFTRHLKYFLLLNLIWFYAMVTGFSPSVIRAAAMISFVIFGKWVDRNASVYNLLCGSCFLLFIFDPFLIRSTGFVLSFLAVCGIIFYHKLLLPLWVPPNKIMFMIWELTSVSLAAQLTTFPLSMFLFHQFPNYFLIANLIIIPLSTGVMYSGLLILVTDWVPFAGFIFGWITTKGILLLNLLVNLVASLPGALTTDIYISGFETLLIYLGMIVFTLWLTKKSLLWLQLSMIATILFLGSKILASYETGTQLIFTVYQTPKRSLYTIMDGHQSVILSDTSNIARGSQNPAQLHLLKKATSLQDTLIISSDSQYALQLDSLNRVVILSDLKLLPKNSFSTDSKLKTTVILRGKIKISGNDLFTGLNPSQVVLDNTVNKKDSERLTKDLEELNIPCHSVKKSGAFSISLRN